MVQVGGWIGRVTAKAFEKVPNLSLSHRVSRHSPPHMALGQIPVHDVIILGITSISKCVLVQMV